MDTKALRQKILDLAIHGKLVPQDPNDEPASLLLERIREEKEQLVKEGKIKKGKKNVEVSVAGKNPYLLPEGWEWTTIEAICSKIGSGSTPKGSNYAPSGIPFFRSQNVYNEGLVFDDIKYISQDVHQAMSGTEVLANDLLLNITGGSLGRCAVVPSDFKKGNVSQHVCIMRSVIVSPHYLHAFVLSTFFAKTMKITGSGREGLPKYNLEKMRFPLPPLAEQRRIVSEIEHWFSLIDKIENGKANLKSAVKQAKAKILDMAIHGQLVPQNPNDEPASQLLQRINPKALITEDNERFGKVPKGWCVTRLGEINKYKGNHLDPRKHPGCTFELYSVPIYSSGKPEIVKAEKIGSTKQCIQCGDVLLCKINPKINRVWLVEGNSQYETVASSEWVVVRCPQIDSKFFVWCLRSPYFRTLLESNVSGVGGSLTRAQPSAIAKYPIPLPPLSEQRRIVAKIEELFAQLDRIEAEL